MCFSSDWSRLHSEGESGFNEGIGFIDSLSPPGGALESGEREKNLNLASLIQLLEEPPTISPKFPLEVEDEKKY